MFTLTIQDHNGQVVTQASFDQGSYVLGRMESCDIVLNSTSVSRQHARIFVHNGRCFLEDLGSANGVLVDGQRVVGRRDLGTASQIRIGDYYLFLEYQRPGLSDEQRVLQTVFIPRDSDHFKLVRIYDSFAGEEFVLSETENTVGRTDENFILLSDPSISRHHAVLVREGDNYTVQDLNSSNGTFVNGKQLKMPKRVMSGDRIKFGNVEFLFVEGDAHVDLSQYATPPSRGSNLLLSLGALILVIVGIAIGGTILFSMSNLKKTPTEPVDPPTPTVKPQDTIESKLTALVDKGDKASERGDWDVAIGAYDEALDLSPDDDELLAAKKQAQLEREAAEQLEKGEELSEQGKHEEARKVLDEVPEGTRAHKRAQDTLEHVNRTLAFNYKSEAIRLASKRSKKDLRKAHEKFVQALELVPDDEDALKRIASLEKKMRRRRVKFDAYEP